MHPWTQYYIRQLEIDQLHAQAARERLLAAARIEAHAEQEPRPRSRLDGALARLGAALTRLGRRLKNRAKPIPKTARREARTATRRPA